MSTVDNAELQERLRSTRLVAILRGRMSTPRSAAARTLLQVGVLTLEIALTLQDAEEAIAQIVQDAPATALVGDGTSARRGRCRTSGLRRCTVHGHAHPQRSVPYGGQPGHRCAGGRLHTHRDPAGPRPRKRGGQAVPRVGARLRLPPCRARSLPAGADHPGGGCARRNGSRVSRGGCFRHRGWAGRSSETPRLPAATSRRSRFAPARSSRQCAMEDPRLP